MINDGGIQECKHSRNGRITMYIDHNNWQKDRHVAASRSLGSSKKKSMDDDEDQAFDSFLKTLNVSQQTLSAIEGVKQSEADEPGGLKFFSEDMESVASKRGGPRQTPEGDMTVEGLFKQVPGMCKFLVNKKVTLQMHHAAKKKCKGYGKAPPSSPSVTVHHHYTNQYHPNP